MTSLLSAITNLIIHVISALGYPGVALLMAVQNIAIPIPSEVILPFAGFLISQGRFTLLGVAITGGFGSMVGGLAAYYIGYAGGRPLVEKYGKYVLISRRDLEITEKFFGRFGSAAVFVGQLLPVIRSFVGFPAGITRLPLKKFLPYSFAGSFLWSLILGWVGMQLGENWTSLHAKFQKLDAVIVALIVVGIIFWVWRHIRNRAKG